MLSEYNLLQDFELRTKTVLLRADINVPISDSGEVADSFRITSLLPTIDYCLKNGAKIVLISHFGRPLLYDEAFSLRRLVSHISLMFNQDISFAASLDDARRILDSMSTSGIVLLENLRFSDGESKNDYDYARGLAGLADLYINDAFSCLHRNHASISAITKFLPSCIGFALQKEIEALSNVNCCKPVCAILGGSKISTKITLIEGLVRVVDFLVLGGGIANNFLSYYGLKIGRSIHEPSMMEVVRKVARDAIIHNCSIILPCDAVVSAGDNVIRKSIDDIDDNDIILDAGFKTVEKITMIARFCNSIIMNGPMGVFENPDFRSGTKAVFNALSCCSKTMGVKTILGGGDTVSALSVCGFQFDDFSYISTGGGAFLQWFGEGADSMAGIVALKKNKSCGFGLKK